MVPLRWFLGSECLEEIKSGSKDGWGVVLANFQLHPVFKRIFREREPLLRIPAAPPCLPACPRACPPACPIAMSTTPPCPPSPAAGVLRKLLSPAEDLISKTKSYMQESLFASVRLLEMPACSLTGRPWPSLRPRQGILAGPGVTK